VQGEIARGDNDVGFVPRGILAEGDITTRILSEGILVEYANLNVTETFRGSVRHGRLIDVTGVPPATA